METKATLLTTVLIVCLWAASQPVSATITVNSGNLHASAAAFNSPNGVSDTPPDKPLILPSTSIVADAVALGPSLAGGSHGHAEATVGQDAIGVIDLDAYTFITNGTHFSSSSFWATADVSGTILFSETQSQNLAWQISSQGSLGFFWGQDSISLRDASNTQLLALGGVDEGVQSGTINLAPGDYSIVWSLSAQTEASHGGPALMHFQLAPEPSGVAVVAILGAIVVSRRINRL
jgi:hypothetical protein